MRWCTKTEISIEVYKLIRRYIPKNKKKYIANKIINLFGSYDADCYDGESILEKDAKRYQDDDE